MQTVEENKINYLVFPWVEFTTGSIPPGDKIYILYAYQTMANDSGSYTWMSSSVVERDERWRVATANITDSSTELITELSLKPGTTYEIELRYGIEPIVTWKQHETTWINTSKVWSAGAFNPQDQIILNTDRLFVSGTVEPAGKQYISPNEEIILASGSTDMNEKVYVSSNEDAVLRIYQG